MILYDKYLIPEEDYSSQYFTAQRIRNMRAYRHTFYYAVGRALSEFKTLLPKSNCKYTTLRRAKIVDILNKHKNLIEELLPKYLESDHGIIDCRKPEVTFAVRHDQWYENRFGIDVTVQLINHETSLNYYMDSRPLKTILAKDVR